MNKVDIVIVGGGMVGAASALSLAQLGLKVRVIERSSPKRFTHDEPFDLRVSAISLASEQLLASLGAWQLIDKARTCPYRRLGVSELDLAYTEFNAANIKQSHLGHIIENRQIQLALWQQCEAHQNIELIVGEEVQLIEQSETHAIVSTADSKIETKLVLAADGGNSFVRDLAGIGTTGWNYSQSAMLINVTTELEQQDITWQQFTPTGPLAMLPMSGHNASLVWYHQRDEIKRLAALSNEELTQLIHQHFPEKLGKVTVVDKGFFPLTRRHANQYRAGRVLLLGDAAHSINPLAGQGVNLGFKDVSALAKIIATAMSEGISWHNEKTLNQYQTARKADNLMMMSAMDTLYATFSNNSPILKAIRNVGLFAAQRTPVLKNKVLEYACGLN